MGYERTVMSRKKEIRPLDGLSRVNVLLSEAQDVLGSYVVNAETKVSAPLAYSIGDEVFSMIEDVRWRIEHRLRRLR